MSRTYRIKVTETLRRVMRASDGVSTRLEILQILPPEQMAELLAQELEKQGYERDGASARRDLGGGIKVSVDTATGVVSVQAETCEELNIEKTTEKRGYSKDDEKGVRQQVRAELEKKAEHEETRLQGELTDKLEKQLDDLRQELDQVVNKVTADSLKIKARQIGEIKEMTEDPEKGSLTIVVEV